MTEPTIIHKTALAVIKDKKIIMVREGKNKDVFYMLGGTVEPGEADDESLIREVQEEAGVKIKVATLKYLNEFQDTAHGRENTLVNIKLYLGDLDGQPVPTSEIEEIQYFDSTVDKKHLTPISIQIFDWLKRRNYIG